MLGANFTSSNFDFLLRCMNCPLCKIRTKTIVIETTCHLYSKKKNKKTTCHQWYVAFVHIYNFHFSANGRGWNNLPHGPWLSWQRKRTICTLTLCLLEDFFFFFYLFFFLFIYHRYFGHCLLEDLMDFC